LKGQELDADTLVKMFGEYLAGTSVERIAEELGVGTGTVSRYTNRLPDDARRLREIAIILSKNQLSMKEAFVDARLVLNHPDHPKEKLLDYMEKLIRIEESGGAAYDVALSKVEKKLSDSKDELKSSEAKLESVVSRTREAEAELSEKENRKRELDRELREKEDHVKSRKSEMEKDLSDALSRHRLTLQKVELIHQTLGEEFQGSKEEIERFRVNLDAYGSLTRTLHKLRSMEWVLEDDTKKFEQRIVKLDSSINKKRKELERLEESKGNAVSQLEEQRKSLRKEIESLNEQLIQRKRELESADEYLGKSKRLAGEISLFLKLINESSDKLTVEVLDRLASNLWAIARTKNGEAPQLLTYFDQMVEESTESLRKLLCESPKLRLVTKEEYDKKAGTVSELQDRITTMERNHVEEIDKIRDAHKKELTQEKDLHAEIELLSLTRWNNLVEEKKSL
jgi:chromosome segregation ATPase